MKVIIWNCFSNAFSEAICPIFVWIFSGLNIIKNIICEIEKGEYVLYSYQMNAQWWDNLGEMQLDNIKHDGRIRFLI